MPRTAPSPLATFDPFFAVSALDSLGAMVAVIDDSGRILTTNQTWSGAHSVVDDVLAPLTVGDNLLLACRAHDHGAPGPTYEHMAEGIERVLLRRAPRFELQYDLGSDESARWYLLVATQLPGIGAAILRTDTTVHHTVQDAFGDLAFHDQLTKLPNRWLVLDRLRMALGRATRSDIWATVVFADLDGFKQVNDTLGHAAGDQVLAAVGRRLSKAVRSEDTCGRWGGDEFVVVLELDQLNHLPVIAARLAGAVRDPVDIDAAGEPVRVGLSLGIAAVQHEAAPSQLIQLADEAMYRAKQSHRPSLCIVGADPDAPTFHELTDPLPR